MTDYSEAGRTPYDASEIQKSEPVKEDIFKMLRLANEAQEKNIQIREVATLATYLYDASRNAGNYVTISSESSFCPTLIGSDQRHIPLFEFLEVIDEIIDYNKILEKLPSLSYSQISGAISFLRKITQFNVKGFDIDHIMDVLHDNDVLLSELREAISDQEGIRVLNFD